MGSSSSSGIRIKLIGLIGLYLKSFETLEGFYRRFGAKSCLFDCRSLGKIASSDVGLISVAFYLAY